MGKSTISMENYYVSWENPLFLWKIIMFHRKIHYFYGKSLGFMGKPWEKPSENGGCSWDLMKHLPLVIKHSYGTSLCFMGKTHYFYGKSLGFMGKPWENHRKMVVVLMGFDETFTSGNQT